MNLQQWQKNGWLREHQSSPAQISDLLNIVDRDLADAGTARLSTDWQFGIAYNACLKLCTILLYADADYLDTCRIKRNTVEYDLAGTTSPEEAREQLAFASELRPQVLQWLKDKHPEVSP